MHKKEDTNPRYVEHKWTRGFKRKCLEMDDANHAADYISENEKKYLIEKAQLKSKNAD